MLGPRVEDAVKAVINGMPAADRGNAVAHVSFESDTVKPPYALVTAERAEEDPISTGNSNVRVAVEVTSYADEPAAAHISRFGSISHRLQSGTIAEDLTAARANFHCFGVYGYEEERPKVEGEERREYTSTLSFTAYCAAKDLS